MSVRCSYIARFLVEYLAAEHLPRAIAPKKTKSVKAAKVKKVMEIAIKTKIEQELTQAATSKQSLPFKMVKPAVSGKKPGKKPAKKGAGKKKK